MNEISGKPMKEEPAHERISVVLDVENEKPEEIGSELNLLMMEIPSDEFRMAETYRYLGD